MKNVSTQLTEPLKVNVYGYFTNFKIDTGFCYISCPDCKKKVDDSNYCNKCNKEVNPMRRYLTRATITDSTGSLWITLFDEDMKKVIKITADEMNEINEEDPSNCEMKFNEAMYLQYRFHLNCTVEEYQEQMRPRYTCSFIQSIDEESEDASRAVVRKALELKSYLLPETN